MSPHYFLSVMSVFVYDLFCSDQYQVSPLAPVHQIVIPFLSVDLPVGLEPTFNLQSTPVGLEPTFILKNLKKKKTGLHPARSLIPSL